MDITQTNAKADSDSRVNLLLSALHLSEDMLVAAKEDDWGAVSKKESQRRLLIKQVFTTDLSESGQLPEIVDLIKKLLQNDRELMDAGGLAKQALANNMSQLQKNSQASNAYLSNNY